MRTATFGTRIVEFPYADHLPPLGDDERRDLRDSIARSGIQQSLTFNVRPDGRWRLLDGHHRLQAATDLGLPIDDIPYLLKPGLTDEQERDLVYSLNLDRRHLTAEQKRRLVAAKLRREPAASDREIARGAKVDHKTVGAVREELESTGEIPQLTERVGRDGRARPAKPKSTGEIPQSAPAAIRDALGVAVPPHMADVFGDPWLRELAAGLDGLVDGEPLRQLRLQLRGKSQTYSAYLRAGESLAELEQVLDLLAGVRVNLEAGTPYALCPACQGRGCEDCRQAGWMPRWRYEELHGAAAGEAA